MSVLLPNAQPRWRGIAAALRRLTASILRPIRPTSRIPTQQDALPGDLSASPQSEWLVPPAPRPPPTPIPLSRRTTASPSVGSPALARGSVRDQLSQIPPLPHVVRELLAELSNPSSNARSVARIATSDPALAAALIRTVNSAAFGLRRHVTSIAEAVSFLGYTAVRSLVIRMRLDRILRPAGKSDTYDAEDLWIHSLAVSYAGDCLAQRVPEVDPGFIATLGLLHDIGKLAINSHFPHSAAQLRVRSTDQSDESLLDRERRVLGADHAEIGAMLAEHWKLPRDLVECIRWHHAPTCMPFDIPAAVRASAAIVHIANQLAKYCYVHCDDLEIDIIDDSTFRNLGLVGPLVRQLNQPMRWAISRAIFFADESSQRPLGSIKRFVRLYGSRQARMVAESVNRRDRETRIGWIDDSDIAWLFDPAVKPVGIATGIERCQPTRGTVRHNKQNILPFRSGDAGRAGRKPAETPQPHHRRFSARATPRAVDALIAEVTEHQSHLWLDDDIRLPARFLIRRLLPNLDEIDRGAEIIEVAQARDDGRLHLVIRSDYLAFSCRFGPDADPKSARRVLEQELANVLNLRWFAQIRTSRDGKTLWMVSHPSRR